MPRAIPILLCAALLAWVPTQALAKGPLPEPDEGPDPRGLTLSGSGLARVEAPQRLNEGTIERAIDAARPKALSRRPIRLAGARSRSPPQQGLRSAMSGRSPNVIPTPSSVSSRLTTAVSRAARRGEGLAVASPPSPPRPSA